MSALSKVTGYYRRQFLDIFLRSVDSQSWVYGWTLDIEHDGLQVFLLTGPSYSEVQEFCDERITSWKQVRKESDKQQDKDLAKSIISAYEQIILAVDKAVEKG